MPLTREKLINMGRDIVLYPGVEDWFRRINAVGT